MRATVDLPPAVHRRARELATLRGQSLSSVIAGNVQFTWTGGTETQAEALVALREDPEVSAATISMVRWTRPLWGSGSVTVAADANVQAVRERWEPQLRSIFAWVADWEFARES
ncbi:MAG: hypothetical protein ACTMIR_14995 [Cellulomonadaceae bacterium]